MKILLDMETVKAMIGGDTEVEINVRNSIVQEFSKRHLKAIANSEKMSQSEAKLRQIIREEFGDDSYLKGVIIPSSVTERIREMVRVEFSANIKKECDALSMKLLEQIYREALKIQEMVTFTIRKEITQATMKQIRDEVASRLDQFSRSMTQSA
jgi:hypothetical protein